MKLESEASRKDGFARREDHHYLTGMTDKPKRPRDANQLAKFIVDVATGEAEDKVREKSEAQSRGGKIGAKIRASNLSPPQRSEIAKKAANARWGNDE